MKCITRRINLTGLKIQVITGTNHRDKVFRFTDTDKHSDGNQLCQKKTFSEKIILISCRLKE